MADSRLRPASAGLRRAKEGSGHDLCVSTMRSAPGGRSSFAGRLRRTGNHAPGPGGEVPEVRTGTDCAGTWQRAWRMAQRVGTGKRRMSRSSPGTPGRRLTEPAYSQRLRTGSPVGRLCEAAPPADVTQVKQTLQSNIDRGAMTITKFMADKQLEGGVSLDSTVDTSASQILTDEKGRKYELGDVVAKGGMGAILDAKDAKSAPSCGHEGDARPQTGRARSRSCGSSKKRRSPLSWSIPSIVPIYELGVDASGNVFYTMKFDQGEDAQGYSEGYPGGGHQDDPGIPAHPSAHDLPEGLRRDGVCPQQARDSPGPEAREHHGGGIRGSPGDGLGAGEGAAGKEVASVMEHGGTGHRSRRQKPAAPATPAGIDSVRKDAGADILKTMDGADHGDAGVHGTGAGHGRDRESG